MIRFAESTYEQYAAVRHGVAATDLNQPRPQPSTSSTPVLAAEDSDVPVPIKKKKLFGNYNESRGSNGPSDSTVAEVFAKYLADALMVDDNEQNCMFFWSQNEVLYEKLIPAVLRTFPVPASSAPVERVFSHGGLFIKPNRARLSDKILSALVFLKCNSL